MPDCNLFSRRTRLASAFARWTHARQTTRRSRMAGWRMTVAPHPAQINGIVSGICRCSFVLPPLTKKQPARSGNRCTVRTFPNRSFQLRPELNAQIGAILRPQRRTRPTTRAGFFPWSIKLNIAAHEGRALMRNQVAGRSLRPIGCADTGLRCP